MDNDAYHHVNNMVYYSFFDTAVNRILIKSGVLDNASSQQIGLAVETQCRYFSPIAFPDTVRAGLRVAHLGTSSVRYELAVCRNEADTACAQRHFVHVHVDRPTHRPAPTSSELCQVLSGLRAGAA